MELPYKYDCIQNFFNIWHIEQMKTPFSAQHTGNDIELTNPVALTLRYSIVGLQ